MRREAGDSPHRGPGCTTGHPRVLPRQDDRACVWPRALRVTLLLRFSAAALGVATPHGVLASDAGGRCANVSEAPGRCWWDRYHRCTGAPRGVSSRGWPGSPSCHPQDVAAEALARSDIWTVGRSQARVHHRGFQGCHSKRVASQSLDLLGT